MDYLFTSLMLWGREQGYGWFNLGHGAASPGSRRARSRRSGPGSARFLFRHGEHFYNFQGLRQYKEKFAPGGEPRYLAAPGGLRLPRVLANVAALVSRGLKGAVTR